MDTDTTPPRRTLWMREALARESDSAPTELVGGARADVCIVGGGLTGLWTALHIKRRHPEADVTLLEADVCGAGASGANGGFAMTWWPKIATLAKLMGTDEALRLARASQQSLAEMAAFCAAHDIDADVLPAGWLWVASNESQVDSWDATIRLLDGMGATPFERLTLEWVSAISGTDRHFGGVFEAGVATVQPGALTRGLRRAAVAAGVRVWEKSPMLSYEASPAGVTVRAPRGVVRADHLVLATNAWLARYPQIRRHLMVLGSDVLATAPIPDLIAESEWKRGAAISDSRRLVHYYRTTRDGRIVFGKGGGRISFRGRFDIGTWGTSTRAGELGSHLHRLYPRTTSARIDDTWAGAVDYSGDGLPFAGRLDGHANVSFAVGFSGNGVGPAHLLGKVLAAMATDGDDEWATSPLIRSPAVHLPPEPLRYLGGHLVRSAIRRKEGAEDRGRAPGRVELFLAGLDPTSFVG
jgi:glycine/D-amino acid oxidase-like deaminating enzyme